MNTTTLYENPYTYCIKKYLHYIIVRQKINDSKVLRQREKTFHNCYCLIYLVREHTTLALNLKLNRGIVFLKTNGGIF